MLNSSAELNGTISLFEDVSWVGDEAYNENIVILDNEFQTLNYTAGQCAMQVENAQDVIVSGNTFENCFSNVVVESQSTVNVDL